MSAAAAAASPASSPPQDAAIPAPQPSDRAAESAGAEDGIGGARGRRSAWNISSNGLSEVGGAVMGGAVSWPALSDSARASPKPSSSDSPKSLSDGSISAPPGPAITPPPPKQNMNNPSPSSTPTPASTSRQNHNRNHSNPIGRGGGGGGGNLANGGSPPPPPPPPPPPSEPQPTIEETSQQSARSFQSRSNSSTDHGPRGSGGSTIYPHGGADNHHSRGNRRGHNGGVGGFGNRRNYSYRDAQQMPPPQLQHGPPPPFLRPPPPPPPPPLPPYMGFPPQVRPFIGPMGFPEIHSPMYYIPPYPPFESYKNIGYVAHQMPPVMGPPVVVTPEDHQHALMKQIEYYFSPENLCKDLYLRQKMDDQGWVPISFIANFNRVRQLATNLSYILETVRGSDMLEVEGEKIRRRNVWMNWILPPSSNPYGSTSWSQSPTPSNYDLAGHLQSAGLGEGAGNTGSSPNQVLTGVSSGGSARRNVNSAPRVGESN